MHVQCLRVGVFACLRCVRLCVIVTVCLCDQLSLIEHGKCVSVDQLIAASIII